MGMPIVRPLTDIRAADAAFSGGKGANLGELLAAGLPVPPAFVVGVPAYEQAVGPGRPAPAGAVRDAIVASYRALGRDVTVAVRSSAVVEDGAAASYAGIYQTVLNVTGDAHVLDAVAHCWTAASSSQVRGYGAAQGATSTASGIAVVVQHQIESACAGVAFTADPVTGRTDRIIVESAPGLGDALMAGLVTPERVVVDKRSLGVLSGECPTLSDTQIREITCLALRIEKWYGSPQDIEWAVDGQGRCWIVQARPITTLDAAAATAKAVEFYDPPRPPGSGWTRVNIGEALPGVPTPLTWSLWRAGLGNGQRQSQIRFGVASKRADQHVPLLTLAQGWPVLSVDLLVGQVARIPGLDPGAFSEQFFGTAAHVAAAPVGARIATALRMATRAPLTLALLHRRLRSVSVASRREWQRHAWRPAPDPVALLAAAATRFGQTLTVHTMQTYLCQSLYQAIEAVAGGSAIDLLSGDGDLPEARLAADLWRFSRGQISLDRFLSAHGFHGPDEGEIASPSWRQDPQPVLHAARVWADAEHSRDPRAALEVRRDARYRAQEALCSAVAPPRRWALARLIGMARRALVGREIGKTAFLQDLDVARHAVTFLGADALWHTLDELQETATLTTAEVVARQRIRSQFAAQEPPLSFVGNSGEQPSVADGAQPVITGVGASPGVARGRARVVTSSSAAVGLGAGDVLIARTAEPSWVVMFAMVAGIAIDVGGTLSHAAIIARELGIPCAIGTGNGTQVIPDGALVEVDGSRGTVRILDPQPPRR